MHNSTHDNTLKLQQTPFLGHAVRTVPKNSVSCILNVTPIFHFYNRQGGGIRSGTDHIQEPVRWSWEVRCSCGNALCPPRSKDKVMVKAMAYSPSIIYTAVLYASYQQFSLQKKGRSFHSKSHIKIETWVEAVSFYQYFAVLEYISSFNFYMVFNTKDPLCCNENFW